MKRKGIEILERYGAINIKSYCLVNNYGYTYEIDGKAYDIRFWANCYGVYIGKWGGNNTKIDEAFNNEIGASRDW